MICYKIFAVRNIGDIVSICEFYDVNNPTNFRMKKENDHK